MGGSRGRGAGGVSKAKKLGGGGEKIKFQKTIEMGGRGNTGKGARRK
jgi:hypothetical protein